jgi:hypothetical protein
MEELIYLHPGLLLELVDLCDSYRVQILLGVGTAGSGDTSDTASSSDGALQGYYCTAYVAMSISVLLGMNLEVRKGAPAQLMGSSWSSEVTNNHADYSLLAR